ncbi:hypothetical protein IJ541_07855 [bacterium]|nr:hypothetical protein [bacterium]MBQ9246932.1 hypothetical protein [bacterium]
MVILLTKENEKLTQCAIHPVSIAEADSLHRVKPVTLFNHMQELAASSIEKYNIKFGWSELLKHGYAWFLIRYRIEFDSFPTDVSEIKVLTESRGCKRMNAYRDFEVFDNKTDSRILRGTSSWFIVDIENKSVVNIQKEFPEFMEFNEREDDLKLQKLKSLDRVDFEKIFHVRYDDLDINNHVNNTVYINWALEALDYEFRTSNNLKNLDIYFKHEVKYGEDVISQVKIDKEANTTEHVIKCASTGEELCLLRAEFVKI